MPAGPEDPNENNKAPGVMDPPMDPPGALTRYEGKKEEDIVDEDIDERILKLLGLDGVYDIDYGTYFSLLKERLIESRAFGKPLTEEEDQILRDELKRVKGKVGRFKLKVKKINASSFLSKNVGRGAASGGISVDDKKYFISGSAIAPLPALPAAKDSISESLLDIVKSIRETVDSIHATLQEQSKQSQKTFEINRRERENQARAKKEEGLEKKKTPSILKAADKLIAPAKGLLSKIFDFIIGILLGRAFGAFMDWASDPKNAKKVASLARFIKDWWPALLAAWFFFANPLGKFIRSIVGSIAKLTFTLLKPALKSLTKAAMRNPKAAAVIAGGAALATAGAWAPALFPETVNEQERKTADASKTPEGKKNTENELQRKAQNPNIWERITGQDAEAKEQLEFQKTGKTKSYGFSSGGNVSQVTSKTGKKVTGAGRDTQLVDVVDNEGQKQGNAVIKVGEVVLNEQQQAKIASDHGVNVKDYVKNAKPKAISSEKLGLSGGGIVKYESGGVVGGGSFLPRFQTGGEVNKDDKKSGGQSKEIHPYLTKLNDKNIKKESSAPGLCVTGSLETMQKSGVPNPPATGTDVGNNPRGAAVQLIKNYGWNSIGGSPTKLISPYGTVNAGIFSKNDYAKAVDEGKVPSGALIFQTRHSDWNGTSDRSRGYDMAIAQKQGRSLWNGQPLGQWVYGSTQKVIALTPGGKQGDGSTPPAASSDSTGGSSAGSSSGGSSSGGGTVGTSSGGTSAGQTQPKYDPNSLLGRIAKIFGADQQSTEGGASEATTSSPAAGGGGGNANIQLTNTEYKALMIETMNKGGITDKNERIMFMAQVGHESGEGRYLEEIASGSAYEGRSDLGNTQPGDGKKFKGRGYIQITGRANYSKYGPKVGVPDATENPTKLAEPKTAAKVALAYWMDRVDRNAAKKGMAGMNAVTRNINGGLNGLDDRIAKFKKYEADSSIHSPSSAAKGGGLISSYVDGGLIGLAKGGNVGAPPAASGGSPSEKVMNFLISNGLTKDQAAGIAGNLQQESGFNPSASNGSHYGIAQWDKKHRWPRVSGYIKSQGKDPNSLEGQLAGMKWEAEQRGDWARIKSETSSTGSAVSWLKNFERSGEKPGQAGYENRMKYANQLAGGTYSGTSGTGSTMTEKGEEGKPSGSETAAEGGAAAPAVQDDSLLGRIKALFGFKDASSQSSTTDGSTPATTGDPSKSTSPGDLESAGGKPAANATEGSKIAGELGRRIKSKLRAGPDFSQVHRHPEHPPYSLTSGHSSGSYHYKGRAVDIGAYTKEQGPILKVIDDFNKEKGVKPVELLHGKNEPSNHWHHVHVAYNKGGLVSSTFNPSINLNPQSLQSLQSLQSQPQTSLSPSISNLSLDINNPLYTNSILGQTNNTPNLFNSNLLLNSAGKDNKVQLSPMEQWAKANRKMIEKVGTKKQKEILKQLDGKLKAVSEFNPFTSNLGLNIKPLHNNYSFGQTSNNVSTAFNPSTNLNSQTQTAFNPFTSNLGLNIKPLQNNYSFGQTSNNVSTAFNPSTSLNPQSESMLGSLSSNQKTTKSELTSIQKWAQANRKMIEKVGTKQQREILNHLDQELKSSTASQVSTGSVTNNTTTAFNPSTSLNPQSQIKPQTSSSLFSSNLGLNIKPLQNNYSFGQTSNNVSTAFNPSTSLNSQSQTAFNPFTSDLGLNIKPLQNNYSFGQTSNNVSTAFNPNVSLGADQNKSQSISESLKELREMRARSLDRQGNTLDALTLRASNYDIPKFDTSSLKIDPKKTFGGSYDFSKLVGSSNGGGIGKVYGASGGGGIGNVSKENVEKITTNTGHDITTAGADTQKTTVDDGSFVLTKKTTSSLEKGGKINFNNKSSMESATGGGSVKHTVALQPGETLVKPQGVAQAGGSDALASLNEAHDPSATNKPRTTSTPSASTGGSLKVKKAYTGGSITNKIDPFKSNVNLMPNLTSPKEKFLPFKTDQVLAPGAFDITQSFQSIFGGGDKQTIPGKVEEIDTTCTCVPLEDVLNKLKKTDTVSQPPGPPVNKNGKPNVVTLPEVTSPTNASSTMPASGGNQIPNFPVYANASLQIRSYILQEFEVIL